MPTNTTTTTMPTKATKQIVSYRPYADELQFVEAFASPPTCAMIAATNPTTQTIQKREIPCPKPSSCR
ncbi:MAG: hypothetical protein OEV06_08980 [Anaerolineae bacterium]|nr:hypothetical protein [Anaerolineae bacterium]